ncbi:MAG: prolipoprotein diacylglyceryl transferase [Bdellovibrio sp.]|nr:prolipoprotein diacylglyceryl transferase [Bdellovibrio sp.]
MPEIILGTLRIPTFFLVISLSLSFLLVYLSKRVDQFGKERKFTFDLAILIMVAAFLGGRLMHVFYEEWDYYFKAPIQILYFWNGGFVFFGGMIASWLAAWSFCRLRKKSFTEWADFFTPLLSLSHALGRLGCFFAGCCYGSTCFLPWAVETRHPTALYMVLGELIIFVYLLFAEKRVRPKGQLFMMWVFLHSCLRFYVEFFRADFRGDFYNLPLLGRLSISQLICLGFVLISAAYIILSSESLKKLYNRRPS